MFRIREAHEFVSRDFVNLFHCILLDIPFKVFQNPCNKIILDIFLRYIFLIKIHNSLIFSESLSNLI